MSRSSARLSTRRKAPEDRLRRTVQVLLTDSQYLELLEVSKPRDVSEYVRSLIEDDLSTRRARPKLMEAIEPDDDLYEWEEFVAMCDSGGLIDDDGEGVLATSTEKSELIVRPGQIRSVDMMRPTWATHVVWYNK